MLLISQSECLDCGGCIPLCPEEALFLDYNCLVCSRELCTDCNICVLFCPISALEIVDE